MENALPCRVGEDARRSPTSSIQDGLLAAAVLHPGTPALTICRWYQLTGPLDTGALRAAWFFVLDRQQALRTVLVEDDGAWWQEVTSPRDESFRFLDMAGDDPASLERRCIALAGESLDLTTGPLARLTVIRAGDHQYRLGLVLHRAVADESSISLLVDEVSAAYSIQVGDEPDPAALPELRCQYGDYARWQREQQLTHQYQQSRDWWVASLTSTPAAPPAGPSAPPGGSTEPATPLPFDWGPELTRQLVALARAEDVARLTVLLAAFQVLLGRHTGEDRVVVGVPTVVRPQPQFGVLIGPFTNLLAVPGDLSGEPTFRQLLRRVDQSVRDALNHREVPFPDVVQAVRPHRVPGRQPLCQVTLSLHEPAADPQLTGTVVRPLPSPSRPALTDLALTVSRVRPTFAGTLGYDPDRVGARAAAGLLAQLRVLLQAAADHPDQPIGRLPLTTAAERDMAVRESNLVGTAVDVPQPVHQLVADRAARQPALAAVEGPEGPVSYRDLEARVRALTAGLRTFDTVPGAPVAVRMASGPDLVAASLAVLRVGSHLTWFNPGDAGQRGRTVLTSLAPACLLVDDEPERDPLARWFQQEQQGLVLSVDTLTALGGSGKALAPGSPADLGHDPDHPAYVAYTSGSTGTPKGVRHTHRTLTQFATWMGDALALGPGARVAQWAALEHDPSLYEVFATLVAGGTLCPVPPRIRTHPERIVDWLAREQITTLQTIPSFARELLAAVQQRGSTTDLACLTRLVLMGEALPPELANAVQAALPGVRLLNIYGPTETVAATWYEVAAPVTGQRVPIGYPIPGRQVLILDQHDQPCPPGVVGEIVVRGPYEVSSYLGGSPDDAAFRPVTGLPADAAPLPCYRTGDLGRWRWDGPLEYAGRRDFQVKLAGNRFELAEVEAALAAHESVADCAITPLTDPDGLVTRLVAYVVPRTVDGQPSWAAQWRAHLRGRFGHSMLRVSFVTLTDIPRTVAGKVDRQRLPDPHQVAEQSVTRSPDPVEAALAEIWHQVLGHHPVDVEQSFFAAGGDSRQLVRLGALVRDRLRVEIPLGECYANPSLAGMATVVATATAHRSAAAT